MAFVSKIGNILKQAGNKNATTALASSTSSLYQSIRMMSSAKLFVGGLSYGTDEAGLRQAFSQFGEVVEARIITDRDSGRSRGFGFVSYTSTDDATSAMQAMDGKELHSRTIRVNYATEKPRPGFGGNLGGGIYGGGPGGGYGGGSGSGYGGNGGFGDGSYGGGGDSTYGGRSNNVGGYNSGSGYQSRMDRGNGSFSQASTQNDFFGDNDDEPSDGFANTTRG